MNKTLNKKMCVYRILNLVNNKSYIGISKLRFTLRYGGKWWENTHNSHLKNSVNKHGLENFTVEILESDILSYELLLQQEVFYIKLYDCMKSGYNKTSGGVQPVFSQESCFKKSNSLKKYYAEAGGSPLKGKPGCAHTDETKAKLSKIMKNKPGHEHTQEYKDLMSGYMTGRVLSEETKAKLSSHNKIANLGANNPNAKSIVNVETGVIYGTIKAAADSLNVDRHKVARACYGQNSSLPFKFLKDL